MYCLKRAFHGICVFCILGFKSTFSLANIQTVLPPPPPGLGPVISKPPPGFTGVPLNSNVAECTVPALNRLAGMKCSKDKILSIPETY